jgi:hypothetical protein
MKCESIPYQVGWFCHLGSTSFFHATRQTTTHTALLISIQRYYACQTEHIFISLLSKVEITWTDWNNLPGVDHFKNYLGHPPPANFSLRSVGGFIGLNINPYTNPEMYGKGYAWLGWIVFPPRVFNFSSTVFSCLLTHYDEYCCLITIQKYACQTEHRFILL